jgi:hypothetical protein
MVINKSDFGAKTRDGLREESNSCALGTANGRWISGNVHSELLSSRFAPVTFTVVFVKYEIMT